MDYQVNVAMERDVVVLEARRHLDASAGRHIVELARLVIEELERPMQIDLGGVRSSTPGGASLVNPRNLQALPGMIAVRAGRSSGWNRPGRSLATAGRSRRGHEPVTARTSGSTSG